VSKRIINFPEINWEKLHEGAISKEMVWGELEKSVKFLLEVQMLKKTSFLSRDTLEKAREVSEKMAELKQQYPQIIGVVQNILGRKIKEMVEKDGDSKVLFSRLEFLVQEAVFYGSLREWSEKDLAKVPFGLKKGFEVRLYDPRSKQSRHFLPTNWRNNTHKRTALVLRDLSFKARNTYRAEKGIPVAPAVPQKPAETPKELIKTKSKSKPKKAAPKKKKAPARKKTTQKDEVEKKAAKRVKKVRVEDEKKEAEKEIREAKKGISLTDNPDALDFLKK